MTELIKVDRDKIEQLAADVNGIVSQAAALQTIIDNIVVDKERYNNVPIEWREKNIAFGLAMNLQKLAQYAQDDTNNLITGGVENDFTSAKSLQTLARQRKYHQCAGK